MWADWHYQGAGEGRENVWNNMKKLSGGAEWIKPWDEEAAN